MGSCPIYMFPNENQPCSEALSASPTLGGYYHHFKTITVNLLFFGPL